jgi:hypothetical protein
MSDDGIKLTREELYEKMWATPATKLAKEFGISDVALGKICKKLNIPKPYPGYWQQLAVGRRVHREPLPPIKQGVRADIMIYPNTAATPFQPQDPEVVARVESESRPDNRIHVPDTLHGAHPLVRQTRQVLEKAKPDEYGMVRTAWNHRCLNLRVSKAELHRTLRIMDALIKALEARGCSVEVAKEDSPVTLVLIGEEKLKVRLTEKVNRTERELPVEEKRKPSNSISDRWLYTPSGKLSFEIDEYCYGYRKKWVDKAQNPLEDQLNDVIAGLVTAAEAERLKRLEREEQQRRWKEEERRRMKAQELLYVLERQIESWSKSRTIREFLRACESSSIERSGEIAPDTIDGRWLRWAHGYADQLDPLKNGQFEESLRRVDS